MNLGITMMKIIRNVDVFDVTRLHIFIIKNVNIQVLNQLYWCSKTTLFPEFQKFNQLTFIH